MLELLSPAKDLQCAKAALMNGADAIYMGAPRFSARRNAACTIEDIKQIADLCHFFGARLYIALNTLLEPSEIKEAVEIAWQVYDAGADVLIVQDLQLLTQKLPPIELHASTQLDNRTPEKVKQLQELGFKQVVLARELELNQIEKIYKETGVRIEAFIHGALCVSYSGCCYMSLSSCGRSANKGACSQPCRLPYSFCDKQGKTITPNGYLLSLKDMNQSENLERMIKAGVRTFKIEGRLKDATYVANTTLHYRRLLDEIIARNPQYKRASSGQTEAQFEPDVNRSFNRSFTTYFINGRQKQIGNVVTPKSMGERIGAVKKIGKNFFILDTDKIINNNDGLCFVTANTDRKLPVELKLEGIKVNTAEICGRNEVKITPLKMPQGLGIGNLVMRNQDVKFDQIIENKPSRRTLEIAMQASMNGNRISLKLQCENGIETTTCSEPLNMEAAKNTERATQTAISQLGKLGDTSFRAGNISVDDDVCQYFVPASAWNALRRTACEHLSEAIMRNAKLHRTKENNEPIPAEQLPFRQEDKITNNLVMTTKHCLMYAAGKCLKNNPQLRATCNGGTLTDLEHGNRYTVEFDCGKCEMKIFRE